MRIEVAAPASEPTKTKGDLLEDLTADLLCIQNYAVETQIRVTASELDLLCRHKVSNRSLYVECKAHRDALSSNELKNILGTIELKGYDEGWLLRCGKVILVFGPCEDVRQANDATALAQKRAVAR